MFAQLVVAARLDRPDRNEWVWAHPVERMALGSFRMAPMGPAP
jgi:hypothetical protein